MWRTHPDRNRGAERARDLLLGLATATALLTTEGRLGAGWPTKLFYGVLTAYVLLLLLARPVLYLIAAAPRPLPAAILLALASLALSALLRASVDLGGDVDMAGSFVPCVGKRLMLIGYGVPNAS